MKFTSDHRHVPRAYHAIAGAFVIACCALAMRAPELYGDAMQEDRFVEWATVVAFACAAAAQLARAVRERRVFDGLVGLFLLFVAGEEMSWGQRILGLTPPAYFLEHNAQQELNLHNFSNSLGGPRWPFVFVLAGYAVLLPLAAWVASRRHGLLERLLQRIGATPPPSAAIPWFIVAIVLLVWYPFRFTGEWVELLSGTAFLVSAGLATRTLAAIGGAGAAAAYGLTLYSALGTRDPALIECARHEIDAIGSALNGAVLGEDESHRRVWTYVQDGRVDADTLEARLEGARCPGVAESPARREFAADPWGTAYWLRVERGGRDAVVATLYSFGPNRRRDMEPRDVTLRETGDDVYARLTLRVR